MAENTNVLKPDLIQVGNVQIPKQDLKNQLNSNYESFRQYYGPTLGSKEMANVDKQYQTLIKNIDNGNVSINADGTFNVADPQNSGLDFTKDGAGEIAAYYVSTVAQNAANSGLWNSDGLVGDYKIRPAFSGKIMQKDFDKDFFGDSDTPDTQSWYDMDEVTTDKDGNKHRGTQNRINYLLKWLDRYSDLSGYSFNENSLGDEANVRARIDRLKTALSDGVLNNEDYAAASALGLNLRSMLADDVPGTSPSGSAGTDPANRIRSLIGVEDPNDIVARAESWKIGESPAARIGTYLGKEGEPTEYYKRRIKTDKSGAFDVKKDGAMASYYRNTFFPQFFQRIRTEFSPEYVSSNINKLQHTWNGDIPLYKYLSGNLNLAIANKLYDNSSLLGDYGRQLNNLINRDGTPTGWWTIPGTFDEKTGNIYIYNRQTGEYKRVNIRDTNLGTNQGGQFVSLMADYLAGKGALNQNSSQQTQSEKNGGRIERHQYGGNLTPTQVATTSAIDNFRLPTAQEIAQQKQQKQQQLLQQQANQKEQQLEDARNRTVVGQGGVDLSGTDIARLTALGQDVGALVASFLPGYGTAASGVLGITSTLTDLGADIADPSVTKGQVISNALTNAGLAAIGMIPGGKSAGLITKLIKWAPRMLAIGNAYGMFKNPAVRETWKKIADKGVDGDYSEQDFQNVLYSIKSALSLGQGAAYTAKNYRYGGLRNAKQTQTRQEVTVKNGDADAKVQLSKEQLADINSSKTATQANERLQRHLTNNGVENADQYKVPEGHFPEEAVMFAKLRNKKTPIESNKEVTITPQNRKTVQELRNDRFTSNHSTVNKWLSSNYDIFVNGKSPVHIPIHLNVDWKMGRMKPEYAQESTSGGTTHSNGQPTQQQGQVQPTTQQSHTQQNTSQTQQAAPQTQPQPSPQTQPQSAPQNTTPSLTRQQKTEAVLKVHNVLKNRQSLKGFLQSRATDADKLAIKDVLDKLDAGIKISDLEKKDWRKLANAVYKMHTRHIAAMSAASSTAHNAAGVSSHKLGGVLKYDVGGYVRPSWEVGENDFTSDWGDILAGVNANNEYTFDNGQYVTYGNTGNGIGGGRYGTSVRPNAYDDNYKQSVQNIENAQYYKDFTNALTESAKQYQSRPDQNSNNNNLFWRWAHKVDQTLPVGNTARFFDDADQLRNGWSLSNQDYYHQGPTSYRKDQLVDYITHLRNDHLLANRHNDLLRVGNRFYTTDPNGNRHWVNASIATKYKFLRENPDISRAGNTQWNDYEIAWNDLNKPATQLNISKPEVKQGVDIARILRNVRPWLLEAKNAADNINFNNRNFAEYAKNYHTALVNPYSTYRQVYGDYQALKDAENAGARLVSQASQPYTSNASLAYRGILDATDKANQYRTQANAQDTKSIRTTGENAAQHMDENTKIANTVANANSKALTDAGNYLAGLRATTNAKNQGIRNNLSAIFRKDAWETYNTEKARDKYIKDIAAQAYAGPEEDINLPFYQQRMQEIYTNLAKKKQEAVDAGDTEGAERYDRAMKQHLYNTMLETRAMQQRYAMDRLRRYAGFYGYSIPYEGQWQPNIIPSTATAPYMAKGGSIKDHGDAMIRSKDKDNDRFWKAINSISKRFWNQVGKMKQPK